MPAAAMSTFEAALAAVFAVLLLYRLLTKSFTTSDRLGLRRLEQKVDLLLHHFELTKEPSPEDAWRRAADSDDKIGAIKLYRERFGVGLKEAKDAVDAYVAGRRDR
jgi:ribosomal protein L7/L12